MLSTGNKVQITDIISKYLIEMFKIIHYRNIFGRYSCSSRKRCCVQENRSKKCARDADIKIIKQRMAGVQLGGRGEASPVLFENQKKCPDFTKKGPDCVHP